MIFFLFIFTTVKQTKEIGNNDTVGLQPHIPYIWKHFWLGKHFIASSSYGNEAVDIFQVVQSLSSLSTICITCSRLIGTDTLILISANFLKKKKKRWFYTFMTNSLFHPIVFSRFFYSITTFRPMYLPAF